MTDFIWGNEMLHNKELKETDVYRCQNEIWFNYGVTTESIDKLIKLVYAVVHDEKLSAYRDNNELEIILHIDSGGGLVSSAFKFIDFIKQLQKKKIKLRTIINGRACSAETLMAIVADKKQITEHSYAMIHELSSVTWGSMTQLRSYQKHLDSVHDHITQIYLKHNLLKKDSSKQNEEGVITSEEIENIMNKETWFSADEYKKAGFVDEIL
jgi:ATP-dependent Clp protease, protease subunit